MAKPKTAERKKARELRREGWSINKIAQALAVSKSSVAKWVQDIPQPEPFTKEGRAARKKARADRIAKLREEKEKERKSRLILSAGRWFMHAPPGYKGKTYIDGRYVLQYRYLMEQKLGRLLRPGEVVHHINGDRLDDRIENLELMTDKEHSRMHTAERTVWCEIVCPACKSSFKRRKSYVRWGKRRGQKLFFCSNECKRGAR